MATRRNKLTRDANELLASAGDTKAFTESFIADINKNLGKVAYLLGEESSPSEIKEFIPTGSTVLDTILTNGKWGSTMGWPVSRLLEISGDTSVGKSLLANHALVNTQKMGGIPILFDEENAVEEIFFKNVGLKIGKEAEEAGLHKLLYFQAGTVENVFNTMEYAISKVRDSNPEKLITVVWDSVASTPTKEQLEGTYDLEGYGMMKAKVISQAMTKITQFIGKARVCLIFTNQLRDSINKFGHGDKKTTPGGKAIPFYSSIRVRLAKLCDIKKGDATIGVTVKAQTRKNRIAPGMRSCNLDIYFSRGIDDEQSWFDTLLSKKLIDRPTKQKYLLKVPDLEPLEFKSSEWRKILADTNVRDKVREIVINSNIIDYQNYSPNFDELLEGEKDAAKVEVDKDEETQDVD